MKNFEFLGTREEEGVKATALQNGLGRDLVLLDVPGPHAIVLLDHNQIAGHHVGAVMVGDIEVDPHTVRGARRAVRTVHIDDRGLR